MVGRQVVQHPHLRGALVEDVQHQVVLRDIAGDVAVECGERHAEVSSDRLPVRRRGELHELGARGSCCLPVHAKGVAQHVLGEGSAERMPGHVHDRIQIPRVGQQLLEDRDSILGLA